MPRSGPPVKADEALRMKKTEIAGNVFRVVDALPLAAVEGGPLSVRVMDVPALALVPWFCEASVQWALRITDPAQPLARTFLPPGTLPRHWRKSCKQCLTPRTSAPQARSGSAHLGAF